MLGVSAVVELPCNLLVSLSVSVDVSARSFLKKKRERTLYSTDYAVSSSCLYAGFEESGGPLLSYPIEDNATQLL